MSNASSRDTNRAQIFEDEKRRIIDSCFNKRDDDGSILETYITHLRIVEFATHPTGPPPPQARTPSSEKPRVIIVAVRKSGRVRVHKSKENPNGTFSIGKTWNLDDLTAIESYTSPSANPQAREWAGDVGFLVQIGKPYYWQAQTDKEKKFFIASLIKIYGKYTGGKTPELTGFDQKELEQILGSAQRRPAQAQVPPPINVEDAPAAPRPPLPEPVISNETVRSLSSGYNGSVSGPANTVTPAPSLKSPTPFQAPVTAPRRPQGSVNGGSSPAGSIDSGRGQNLGALRRLAGTNQSQDSVANSLSTRSDDGSLRPRSRNGVNGAAYPAPAPPPQEALPAAPLQVDDRPPERKRPPMDPSRPALADRDLVPAPLMSPSMRREPMVPPRSLSRASPRKDSASIRSEAASLTDSKTSTAPVTPGDATPTGPPSRSLNGTPAPEKPVMQPPPALPGVNDSAGESPIETEESRPGLGPMIKKKSRSDIRGALWKAANAANAFKPRPGGAGDRLRQLALKSNEGPDGITGVVPAPSREEPRPLSPLPKKEIAPLSLPDRTSVPEVKLTVPGASRPSSLQSAEAKRLALKSPEPESAPTPPPEPEPVPESVNRRSIVAGNDVKYLATLGVDPSILDARAVEYTKMLDFFGWVPGEKMRNQSFDDIKIDIDRELNRAQAGGWLARFREGDVRVDAIRKGIDASMDECEELDNLLTLYSVELSTLSDDIAYIEAQGQGLQVQAANQKLLRRELESLLATCAISSSDLDPLKAAPLETSSGIEQIEAALVTLFRAMRKIDPALGVLEADKADDDSSGNAAGFDSDYGKMRIVQEKKEMYNAASLSFMRRLVAFMSQRFDEAFRETKRAIDSVVTKKVDERNHDMAREMLWRYSPLVLYARDVDKDNWTRMLAAYQDRGLPVYKSEFRDALEAWKRFARKPTGAEADLLFTSEQERHSQESAGNMVTAARKLTVKRSQTLARGLRGTLAEGLGGSKTSLDKTSGGSFPYEVFMGVLDDLLPLVEMEQNFIADFFHATALEQMDFADAVAATRPTDRRGGDLKRHRLMEPNRDMARTVTKAMEVIFRFLVDDLQGLVDWVCAQDPLQGVGVLAHLERKMTDVKSSNQDFLNSALSKLHGALEGRFRKFVDEQIRAIEDTKVKINKRKGVIGFMRIFPTFSAAVENMLANVPTDLLVRRTVDAEYERILKAMFDSLKVIARETPAVAVAAASGGTGLSSGTSGGTVAGSSNDPEDKEALNFHILLIENMNHFIEEVDNAHGLEVLEDWRTTALEELNEHLGLYVSAVVRRPLGKLLEALENIESQLANGKSAAAVSAQPSNSRQAFNRVLGGYDAKEVRRGIDTLRRRIEKHFAGEGEDPAGLSRGLVTRVIRECETFYGEVEVRIERVTRDVYGGEVLFEWPRAEVRQGFSQVGR